MVPDIDNIFNSIPVHEPNSANLNLDFANFSSSSAAPQLFDSLDPEFNAVNVPLMPMNSGNGNGFVAPPTQGTTSSSAQVH